MEIVKKKPQTEREHTNFYLLDDSWAWAASVDNDITRSLENIWFYGDLKNMQPTESLKITGNFNIVKSTVTVLEFLFPDPLLCYLHLPL